ncbi:MAG: oligosaccharide flippase family protein [Candidatus Dadabacteria bacterium]|nr:oligosaccharide flippase family protein [Candidatus Dadabacteria bacterium]
MNELKADKKELTKNVSWLFVAKSVPSAANIVEMIILARFLGLELFGLLTLVVAYVKIISSLLDFRVWESVVKYVGEFTEKNESDNALSMIKFSYLVDVATGLLAFAVCVLLAGVANDVFIKSPDGFELVLIFSFSLVIATANATSEALFRVFDKFKTIVFVKSSKAVFKLSSVLIALYLGYGIRGVLFAYVAVSFFEFLLTQIVVSRMLRDKGLGSWFSSRIGLLSHRMREITWFLVNTSFNATLTIANEGKIAVLVLGYFFTTEAAGLYKVARAVIKVIGRITDPLYEAIFPKLVSLSTLNLYDRLVGIVKFSVRSLLKFIVPVLIAILLFTEQFIGLIFGDQYVPASNTMRVLTIGVLFTGTTFWLTPLLLAVGRPGLRTAVSMFKILGYVALLLVLVPRYSYMGAGITYLVVEFVHFLAAIYLAQRLKHVYLR